MDKKLLIFLAVFFLFLWGYQKFVLERLAPQPKKPVSAPGEAQPQTGPAPAAAPGLEPETRVEAEQVPAQTAEVESVPATAGEEARHTVVETPLYRAEFTSKGAVLLSFRLKKYKDDWGRDLEMVPQTPEMKEHPLEFAFDDKSMEAVANEAVYEVVTEGGSGEGLLVLNKGQKGRVGFLYSDGNHVFRKAFEFDAEAYMIETTVEAARGGKAVAARIAWGPGIEASEGYKNPDRVQPSRAVLNNGEKVKHQSVKKSEEFHKIGATIRWAGVETNYFMATFIPMSQAADAYLGSTSIGKTIKRHNVLLEVAGEEAGPLKFRLFIGPKDYVLLKSLDMNLEDAIDFGFFAPIAKILFFTLKFLYRYTRNYGLAILLLTIIVKILFTPFVQKSFESQRKMQQMQPELKKIQEKYGKMRSDDPRKQSMNTEVMQLHKRYGVNPLGGCLPMLVQMPVLYAFWRLLSNSIELRKAPFVWWLQDLSQPDPYKVLPILMGATMVLQQKMTPISDPTQKTMMYMMPVMFTFISLNLQSGLVLYWLFSNVLAIAHQYYYQRAQKSVAVAVKGQDA